MRALRPAVSAGFILAGAVACQAKAVTLLPGSVEVVVEASAPRTVRFAACEMTNFLSRVFGKDVPIVAAPTAERVPIVLGDCARTRAAGLRPDRLP